MIDPDDPSLISITDKGGDGGTLVVFDRPGCTAGEFLVQGEWLVWRTHEGDKARIAMNDDSSTRSSISGGWDCPRMTTRIRSSTRPLCRASNHRHKCHG